MVLGKQGNLGGSSMNLRRLSTGSGLRVRPVERIMGIASCVVLLATFLGCMSIGGRTEIVNRDDRSSTQSGKVTLAGKQELDVFYPVAYVSPPNLEFEEECVVVEQKADHFRVKNTSPFSRVITWTARGVPPSPSQTALPPAHIPTDSPKTGTGSY
jgi:hypothetical protein